VVAGANGLLVPAGDAEALASAIGRVLDDVALRRTLGVSARQFIERNCSLEQVASRYEEIYQQLAGTRRRTPRSGR
jgi:glycosyltransferase involved in cell wall biosynthesis